MGLSIISTTYGQASKKMNLPDNNTVVHIAGIGALGGLMAAFLGQGNHLIRLILKNQQQLADYQSTHLSVTHRQTTMLSNPFAMDIDHIDNEPIHFLICCVKAYDVTTLLLRLKHHLTEKSIIILIHNGLGVLDEIKTQLPQLRIICGISTLGAYVEKPFTINAFLEGTLFLGRMIGSFSPHEINTISTLFKEAKIPYQWEADIQVRMWEKFAINCSINILTVLFKCKNGGLLAHDAVLKKMIHEVAEVMRAYDFNLSEDALLSKVTQTINNTAENYSSMYKDVQHHKPTELYYLNKHLVRLAEQKKITTPFNIEIVKQFSDL